MSIASLLGRLGFVLSLLLFFSMDMQAGKSPLFIENKGQWDKQVLFMARCDGYAAWVTQTGITFDYYRPMGNAVSKSKNSPHELLHHKKTQTEHHVIQMTWDKGLPPSDIVRSNQSRTWHNYYYGNDPTQWAEHVALHGEVLLRNVWTGIDIRLYFENNNLRYDFHTAPHAMPQSIVLKFDGADYVHITPSSALELGTHMGKVVHDGLMAFQYIDGKKTIVHGHFKKLSAQRVGINLDEYHHDTPLIIDPYVYQTFLGGGADDLPFDMVILNNATLVTGTTQSTNFPTKAGYDNTFNLAKSEAYMTYMQEDGKDIVWSTYLGQNTIATQQNYGSRLFIHNNEIYLVGVGGSASFPTTTGLYDNTNDGVTTPGEGDGFFAKFSAGGGLLFSTFIGGPNGVAYPFGLARANDGDFIISGITPTAKRIPTTINGYLGGNNDFFVMKMTANGANRPWARFLGGAQEDGNQSGGVHITNVAVLSNGNIAFSGGGSYSNSSNRDCYVALLSSDGNSVINSFFVAGSGDDIIHGMALDKDDNIFITGETYSSNFPIPSGGFAPNFTGTGSNGFIIKYSPSLAPLSGTFISATDTKCFDIAIAKTSTEVFISGVTGGPTTFAAFVVKPHAPNLETGIIAKFNNSLNSLLYGSYNTTNDIRNIEVSDAGERFWINGFSHPSMITTPGVYDNTPNGAIDNFISFICIDSAYSPTVYAGTTKNICLGESVEIGKDPIAGNGYLWTPPTGVTNTTASKTFVTPTTKTRYTVVVRNGANCPILDTVTVFVFPKPIVPDSVLPEKCLGSGEIYRLPRNYGPGHIFKWDITGGIINGPDDLQDVNVTWNQVGTGTLTARVTGPGNCTVEGKLTVRVNPAMTVAITEPKDEGVFVCYGKSVQLQSVGSGGTGSASTFTYRWEPATGLNSATIAAPVATPTTTTKYKVTITDTKGCSATDSVFINVGNEMKVSLGNDLIQCFGVEARLVANVLGGDPPYIFEWRENGTTLIQSATTNELKVTPLSNMLYTVMVSDVNNCVIRDTIIISVNPEIKVNVGDDMGICIGEKKTLNPQVAGIGPFSYQWQPTTGLSDATILTPEFTASVSGQTKYTLTVTGKDNCTGKDEIIITVGGAASLTAPTDYTFPSLSGCENEKIEDIEIQNTGTDPIVMSPPTIIGNDFTYLGSDIPLNSIPGGARVKLKIRYAPQNQGNSQATLRLVYNPCNQTKDIILRGNKSGITAPQIPDSVNVGDIVCETMMGSATFTITTTGTDNFTMTVNSTNGASSPDLITGVTLFSGSTQTFRAQLTAQNTTPNGYFFGYIDITLTPCSIQKRIKITGRRITPPTMTASNPILNFGIVNIGSPTSLMTILTNTGTTPIPLNTNSLANVAGQFSILSTNPVLPAPPQTIDIQPGGRLEVTIGFSATVIGEESDKLEVTSPPPCALYVGVELIGEVIDVNAPSIEALDFAFPISLKIGEIDNGTVTVINNGKGPVTISSAAAVFESNDDAVFSVLPFTPQVLANTNDQMTIPIRFAPQTGTPDGVKLGILKVTGQDQSGADISDECTIKGIVTSTFIPTLALENHNFGTIGINTSKDKDIEVTTNSPTDEIIQSVIPTNGDMGDFAVIGFVPKAVNKNQPLSIKVRFTPQGIGAKQITLTATSASGLQTTSTITGAGASSSAVLVVGNNQGYPGDIVSIPIQLTSANQLAISGAKQFNAQLVMNATVLEPTDPAMRGTISGFDRTINLTLPIQPITSNILGTIECRVMLGTDDTITLQLQNLDAGGAPVGLSAQAGKFTVLGICEAGGKRLFNPYGMPTVSIMPNPPHEGMNIDIHTVETGHHTLRIISSLGETVAVISDGILEHGDYTFSYPTDKLSNGTYRVIVQTPTMQMSTQCVIMK